MNFVKRVISGLTIVAVTLGVMWYNNPFFLLFLVLMGTLMAWEWEQMLTKRTTILSVLMTAVSAVTVFLTFASYFVPVLILIALFYISVFIYLRKTKQDNAGLFSFGVLYTNIPLFSLTVIASFYEVSEFHENAAFMVLLWLFMTVWTSDIGGYVFGHLLKGPKLAPKISPNKTWAGFFGGIFLAVAASVVYVKIIPFLPNIMTGMGYVFDEPKHMYRYFVLFTAAVSVVSQIGDLFESMIKRKLQIKDSSNLIPGHGGVFDRYDGMLAASVFVAVAMAVYWGYMAAGLS